MGNLVDAGSGGAVDDLQVTAFRNPQDELVMSLRSFVFLYDQHEHRLQSATKSFREAATRLQDVSSSVDPFSLLGGAVGGVCGGITGVVGGSLGAVAAATYSKVCGKINAVEATVGFFGSMLGGVSGGVFSGAVGGAVGVAVTPLGKNRAVNKAVWFTVGLVTGGAVGGIFGGSVGAAGGAVGGGFGALCGTGLVVCLFGGVTDGVGETTEVKTVQNAADKFSKILDPLVQQLRLINAVGAESSGVHEKRVATQASRTLVAVTTAQRSISDCSSSGHLSQPGAAAAATQSSEITEELRRMRSEAKNFLGQK